MCATNSINFFELIFSLFIFLNLGIIDIHYISFRCTQSSPWWVQSLSVTEEHCYNIIDSILYVVLFISMTYLFYNRKLVPLTALQLFHSWNIVFEFLHQYRISYSFQNIGLLPPWLNLFLSILLFLVQLLWIVFLISLSPTLLSLCRNTTPFCTFLYLQLTELIYSI